MTGADIVTAAELLRRGAWGERELFFAYAVEQSHVMPFVAERDGSSWRRASPAHTAG